MILVVLSQPACWAGRTFRRAERAPGAHGLQPRANGGEALHHRSLIPVLRPTTVKAWHWASGLERRPESVNSAAPAQLASQCIDHAMARCHGVVTGRSHGVSSGLLPVSPARSTQSTRRRDAARPEFLRYPLLSPPCLAVTAHSASPFPPHASVSGPPWWSPPPAGPARRWKPITTSPWNRPRSRSGSPADFMCGLRIAPTSPDHQQRQPGRTTRRHPRHQQQTGHLLVDGVRVGSATRHRRLADVPCLQIGHIRSLQPPSTSAPMPSA